MTTPPPLALPTVGFPASAAYLTAQVYNPLNFLYHPPMFMGYQSTAQSIASGLFTSVNIDTEIIDTAGGHSTSTNNSRYTFQVAGWYRLDGVGCFASNATGFRGAKFYKNGSTEVFGSEILGNAVSGFFTTISASGWVQAAVGDYVELQLYQNSGSSLSTGSATGFQYVTCMRVQWISA